MVNGANLCIFEGRIVKEPNVSTFQGQNGVIKKAFFTIAVDRSLSSNARQQAKNDNSIKTSDFINCSLVGNSVDVLERYFPKGKPIRIVAHYQEYQTKDKQTGETKYGHTFVVDNIGFCVQDPKGMQQNQGQQQYNNNDYGNNNYNQQAQQQYNNTSQQQYNNPQEQFSMFDDSISPF